MEIFSAVDVFEDWEIALTNHATFLAIAHTHYQEALALVKERDGREVKIDTDADFNALKNAEIQRAAMIVVVFSALTLEAFINWYALEKFSRSFFKKHVDRLPIRRKWLEVPKRVVGKLISAEVHKDITSLFNGRDELVHYKASKKRVKALNEGEDWVTEEHAHAAYETVKIAVAALKDADDAVDIDCR